MCPGTSVHPRMATSTTNASHANATTPSATGTPAPRAPFCLNCGFNFGHVADGIDDAAAGALIVSIFVLLLAVICFGVGCVAHARHIKKSQPTYTPVATAEKPPPENP